jgi:hypothetical protein
MIHQWFFVSHSVPEKEVHIAKKAEISHIRPVKNKNPQRKEVEKCARESSLARIKSRNYPLCKMSPGCTPILFFFGE